MPAELDSVRPAKALQGINGHIWEQVYLPTQLQHRLLWSPGNTGPLTVGRQVLTVHDLASLEHPEWFERKFALWYGFLLPRLVRKVRAIITVSHFSKERIVQLMGAEPERIQVIPNGVEERFRPADREAVKEVRTSLDLKNPYILYVGSVEPRKNLPILLEAWRTGGFDGATLAIAGASGHLFARLQFDSVPKGVRLLGPVEDNILPILYSGAAGFVYPSVYEGFGLPPLEALACGCPVAVSDIPVHRELFDGTAIFFDPFNTEELASKLERLLSLDGGTRASLIGAGLRRAACYNWQRAASETWRILNFTATCG